MKALFMSMIVMGLSVAAFSSEKASSSQQAMALEISFRDLNEKIGDNIVHPLPPFSIENRRELEHLVWQTTFSMSDILEALQSENSITPVLFGQLDQLLQQINTARNQFALVNDQPSNSFTVAKLIRNIEYILELENKIAVALNAPRPECRTLGLANGYAPACRSQF